MNDRDYNAMEGIRRSDLWKIKQSPLHFRWHMDHPEEPTPALIFGRAMHKYLLEPETFRDEFAIAPSCDRRTKEGRRIYEDFADSVGDREVLTLDDMERIGEMKRALMENDDVADLMIRTVQKEEPYQWIDAETHEMCKVKADAIADYNGDLYIIDYKTTVSCADGAFERSVRKYGYDFQAGMYTEGVNCATLQEHGFVFIAQEKDAPYASRVYWCDAGFIKRGMAEFHDLLRTYHECKKTNTWKGYESADLYSEEWL